MLFRPYDPFDPFNTPLLRVPFGKQPWWHQCVLTPDGVITDVPVLLPVETRHAYRIDPLPYGLLVMISGIAFATVLYRYEEIVCVPLHPVPETDALVMTTPLRPLSDVEQQVLARWLITNDWTAWARSGPKVRAVVGYPEEPLWLPEAAAQSGITPTTLVRAARARRLPTLAPSGGRMVYLATIREAIARRKLRAPKYATGSAAPTGCPDAAS